MRPIRWTGREAKQRWIREYHVTYFWYLGFMIAGDFVAYFIGLFVEYEWGSHVSLIVFLTLYFLSLWVAWLLSVWVTKPKKAAPIDTP
jgi:hypothetical protein